MSGLATSLRIARRDALRSKGRSALVVLMIALPVLGVGAADVLWRTFQLSPEQKATRQMGAAQATYENPRFFGALTQDAHAYATGVDPQRSSPVLSSFLPAGTRVLFDRGTDETPLTAGSVTTRGLLRALDYTDPLAKGLYVQRSGRPAHAADEVVLTTAYARRLHVGLGGHVSRPGRHEPYLVVGLVDDGSYIDRLTALVSPRFPSDTQNRPALVALPRAMTWDDVKQANAAGYVVRPRHALPGSPPAPAPLSEPLSTSRLTALSLIVGMGLLEIVLLAGPAFAVGAKRQSRDLALLSATGGARRDVRRTVLGSGVVLGGVGGITGVLVGIAMGRVFVPALSRRTTIVPGPFDVRPLDLLLLAVVGLTTAVLAAVIPARAATRQDVVAALTGRRGQLRSLRRTPVIGIIVAALGAALAFQGAQARSINTILAGSALAELGLVATTPFLVGLIGRLSPLLPLGPRLALRDASRNRGRTAPAVSAVLAAVAGSVAVGTYFASTDAYNREAYTPFGPKGSAMINLAGQNASAAEAADVLRRAIPGSTITVVQGLSGAGTQLDVDTPTELRCPIQPGTPIPTREELIAADRSGACRGNTGGHSPFSYQPLVGGPELVTALTGERDPHFADVLTRGGFVGPQQQVDTHGNARMRTLTPLPNAPGAPPRQGAWVEVPAAALPSTGLDVEVLSPAAAARAGLHVVPVGVVAFRATVPSAAEEDRARKALQDIQAGGLQVERGYQPKQTATLLALLLGSSVIVLGASGIATGLAAADGKADLATLAAVGASPTTRRTLAAFQSAVTAGLGTLLGTAAGLVPAIGMVRALNSAALHSSFPRLDPFPLVLPWRNIVITVLVVPLLAALAAALLTRSKLPLVRRLA